MKALVLPGLAIAALSGCVAYPYDAYGGYGYSQPAVVPQATFIYDSGPAYRQRGWRDRDRDGVANRYDRDRDGDGVRNRDDRRPNNPRRQ
jgi:hypothetical protein